MALLLGAPGQAAAAIIPIDLNDFWADPSVTVAPDGFSAELAEDPGLSFVLLINDPFFGDPNVIIPGLGTRLLFDHDFREAAGENDEFRAAIFDSDTGIAFDDFVFFASDSSLGTVIFDLSSLAGRTLGLDFSLASLFGDTGFGSTVLVSNVRLDVPDGPPVSVPEPSTLLLFATGALLLAAGQRRRAAVGAFAAKRRA